MVVLVFVSTTYYVVVSLYCKNGCKLAKCSSNKHLLLSSNYSTYYVVSTRNVVIKDLPNKSKVCTRN